MRLKLLPASLILSALTACAMPVDDLRSRLPTLTGKPVSYAFEKLGLPTSEQRVAGVKMYVWSRSRIIADIGSLQCTVRIMVDSAEVIRSADFDGNNGGCSKYAAALEAS